MRLSVDKTDPGYSSDAFGATVTLDGKLLGRCITADEESGEALCYATDADGNVLEFDGGFKTVLHKGNVVITPKS